MLCGNPTLLQGGLQVPCGRCYNCRINRQRFWTGRILAESVFQPHCSFWTLTYDDEHVPFVDGDEFHDVLNLSPRDLQLFIKRWRKFKPEDEEFRYFAVGEYGDRFGRPHYHLVAFGPPVNLELETRVKETWGKGRISVSELNRPRAAYCAAYTLKKMTKTDDSRLVPGQQPEFFRCSRKPALGARLMEHIAAATFTRSGSYLVAATEDVPKEFRLEGRRYSIGRYWINKLREVCDAPEKANLEKIKAEQARPEYKERISKAKATEKRLFILHSRKTGRG